HSRCAQYIPRLFRFHRPCTLHHVQADATACLGAVSRHASCCRITVCHLMKLETPTPTDFSDEQKRYLEGFMSGLQVARVGRNIGAAGAGVATDNAEPTGPDAAHLKAQDKVTASGKKLA